MMQTQYNDRNDDDGAVVRSDDFDVGKIVRLIVWEFDNDSVIGWRHGCAIRERLRLVLKINRCGFTVNKE